ncbi:MAG: flagellar protein FlgN [Phycisphaerales bacterium]|jgi:hypothetical protein|nr:flagellar protein FlgN [Phycisphaerales bacterium]
MTRTTQERPTRQAQGTRIAQMPRGVQAAHSIEPLQSVLRESLEITRRLLDATRSHRAAISRADASAMGESVRRQAELVEALGALDAKRREAMRAWGDGATLGTIVERITREGRVREGDELRALGNEIRKIGGTLQREQASVRLACQMLVAHGEGLVEQVRRRLSHAGTYSRRGGMHVGQPVVSGLDLVR